MQARHIENTELASLHRHKRLQNSVSARTGDIVGPGTVPDIVEATKVSFAAFRLTLYHWIIHPKPLV